MKELCLAVQQMLLHNNSITLNNIDVSHFILLFRHFWDLNMRGNFGTKRAAGWYS